MQPVGFSNSNLIIENVVQLIRAAVSKTAPEAYPEKQVDTEDIKKHL
jgi:hypothetical protein